MLLLKLERLLLNTQNVVSLDSQRSTQDVINMKAQLLTIENQLQSCAGQHRVETLAAAFEEQRLRLDSVITGRSTTALSVWFNAVFRVHCYRTSE